MRIQETFFSQLHGQGQTVLTAQRGQAVRLFLDDDAANGLQRQRLNVDLIRRSAIRHNGRGVGVDQDNFQTSLLQRTAGLGTSVVEFSSLSDDDRTRTNDQYPVQLRIQRHSWFPPII